jgi:hypothetical protein
MLLTLALAMWRHARSGGCRMLIVALVAFAAFVSMGEGFLTYSIFTGIYYSIVLYFVFFLSLVLIQGAIDGVAARTLRT